MEFLGIEDITYRLYVGDGILTSVSHRATNLERHNKQNVTSQKRHCIVSTIESGEMGSRLETSATYSQQRETPRKRVDKCDLPLFVCSPKRTSAVRKRKWRSRDRRSTEMRT